MARKYVFTHLYDTEDEAQSARTLLTSKFSSLLEKIKITQAPYGFILQIDTKEISESVFREIAAEIEPPSRAGISPKPEELEVTEKPARKIPKPKPKPKPEVTAKPVRPAPRAEEPAIPKRKPAAIEKAAGAGKRIAKSKWLWAGGGALLLVGIGLTLALTLIPKGTGTTTIPETPTTPTTSEVYDLFINDHNPEVVPPAVALDYWAEQVMEQSGGRLNITVIHGGALFTGDEVYGAVKSGACDGGHYVVSSDDGFLLSTFATSLPFMGWPDQETTGQIYKDLLDEFPEMQAEWEGTTVIGILMTPPTQLHFVDKVVRTPDDIKGMKIFCAEATSAEIMNAVGAIAVEGAITDMTPYVQNGVVQGFFNHFPVTNVFGALPLLKCHTVFGDGGIYMAPMFLIMNTEKLNSLPSDLQNILLNSGHYWYDKFSELDATDQETALAYCEANNHTMTYLTPTEIEEWYNLVKVPIHDKWIAECEAAGLPGQEVYNRVLELASSPSLLFEDDFSNSSSGWAVCSYEDREFAYENGEYSAVNKKANQISWSYIQEAGDFSVEVDVRDMNTGANGNAGIIFRMQYEQTGDSYIFSHYLFQIRNSDGAYSIHKWLQNEWFTLKDWTYSEYIKTSTSTNRLKVTCQGTTIEVYANGQKLATLTDTSLTSGYIGLAVESAEQPNAHYHFDNFKLYAVK